MRPILTFFLCLSAFLPAAEASTPQGLVRELRDVRLEPKKAVTVQNLKIDTGLAVLFVERGTFFPASTVGGQIEEMVFLGSARFIVEPPDDIEAAQLERFANNPRLDEEVEEAVLAMASDAAIEHIFARPPTSYLDPRLVTRAREVFSRWLKSPERRLLDVELGVLRDALDDPFYAGFFAGRLAGAELGELLYLLTPDAREQVTLGQFVPLEIDKEKKLERRLHKEQRRGRLIGFELEDLGTWNTWMSASLKGEDGAPRPGFACFEPRHYELELSVADDLKNVDGRARIALAAQSAASRVAAFNLHSDLSIDRVKSGDGQDLFFFQSGGEVMVHLPAVPGAGETVIVELEYSGNLIDKVERSLGPRDSLAWYPHVGLIDLATYELTLRWPAKLDLMASGLHQDGGSDGRGRSWERRRLDIPTRGVSFQLGKFRTLSEQAGHVAVTLAFTSDVQLVTNDETRQAHLRAVIDSLRYFEELFGPYPLDELNVVITPGTQSQGLLGFLTLASAFTVFADFSWLLGIEDYRTMIAHEVAHQWWGHRVSWRDYRDQWISEAVANYAAVLFTRYQLSGKRPVIGPTTGWQLALLSPADDGERIIEEVGPLVLGQRLAAGGSTEAYSAIVYKKGAVVLDMLARLVGEESFVRILGEIARVVDHRAISTEDFIALIEKISGRDLDGFARQFIYGTGLPEVFYTYELLELEPGKWAVRGQARQQSPETYRFHLVARDGTLDVEREVVEQIDVASSSLVVPVQIAVHDPDFVEPGENKKDSRAEENGHRMFITHLELRGSVEDFYWEIPYEPKEVWLDHYREVFGRFFNQSRYPKRMLLYEGHVLAERRRAAEAEAVLGRALEAKVSSGPSWDGDEPRKAELARESDELDAQIHLLLARLHLDRGQPDRAKRELATAERLLKRSSPRWVKQWSRLFAARLSLQLGDDERAFKDLRKLVLREGRGGTEGLLLLAIAARQSGQQEELDRVLEKLEGRDVDLTLLQTL